MIEAGTILQGRYRINKQIGQGGMGAVYIGTDERFGSTVAIKETFFSDPNYSKAFEREARLLNNLRHSALPRVSDHFSDENGQFLVMEYITGDDLSEKMERENAVFQTKDVLNWADQLLDALDFLHNQESPVIHRDIKPQNLKLTPRGQVILLDFGLAKGNPTDAKNQTATKSVFGYSRNYASIEQIQGTGTDPRSDLYSLGATLYHLMTGTPPVDALTRAMQVLNGDQDPLRPADLLNPKIPHGVANVLQLAMDLNSNQRPISAFVMREMLKDGANSAIANDSTIKKPQTTLLSQPTQLKTDKIDINETQPLAAKTEILPNSTEISAINYAETETALKPLADGNNLQIPLQPTTATILQPLAEQTNSAGSKRGLAFGATALGGLLLAGTALGGLYVIRPDFFSGTASNSNVNVEKNVVVENPKTNLPVSNLNVENSNVNTNISSNVNTLELTSVNKEVTPKAEVKATPNTPNTPKNITSPSKEITKEQSKPTQNSSEKAGEKEGKIVVQDEEGNKVYDNGKVVAKDGTIVEPNGRIVKNGKVIVDPNGITRPTPPKVRVPLTPDQMRNLTPAQRRRLRRIMQNQAQDLPTPPDN